MTIPWTELVGAAKEVRERAYAPYSHFQVGAALLGSNGKVYAGCNVENASYGLGICAERNAVARAVADGASRVVAVAVVTGGAIATPPCGACRQVLAEFGPSEVPIRMETLSGVSLEQTLGELLPHAFTRDSL